MFGSEALKLTLSQTMSTNSNKKRALKREVADFFDRNFVSRVDNISPIEGVVFKIHNNKRDSFVCVKVQTGRYLQIQKCQMPLFSLLKLNRRSQRKLLQNPHVPIADLKDGRLRFGSVIDKNQSLSLVETLEKCFRCLSQLQTDSSLFNVWFNQKEALELYVTSLDRWS